MSLNHESVGSLFRMGGGWGNISGPGLFMAKALLAGSVAAIAFGFSGAALMASIYGTAATPFIVASVTGFAIGSLGFYHDGVKKAILAMERYPQLLRLHLQANFPARRFDLWDDRRLRGQEFRKSWVLENMLVASWLSAGPTLNRILEQEEDAIISHELSKESWKGPNHTSN